MKIRIACKTGDVLPLDDLIEFQGNLKTLMRADYLRLKKEILDLGFSSPVHVWKHPTDGKIYILDGHQRTRALKAMREEDKIEIPDLPVVFVDAKNDAEAARKVLALTSQYGRMESEGLYEFMNQRGIDIDEIIQGFRFPEIDVLQFRAEFFDTSEPPGDDMGGDGSGGDANPTDRGTAENPMKTLAFPFTPAQYEDLKKWLGTLRDGDLGKADGNIYSNSNVIYNLAKRAIGS